MNKIWYFDEMKLFKQEESEIIERKNLVLKNSFKIKKQIKWNLQTNFDSGRQKN
jgi:hypothetical protein